MRYAAAVEYDGTHYSGWQRQPFFTNTVQEFVDNALSQIANHPIDSVCAGRTDAGVHALRQVIHFDSDAQRDIHSWLAGGNRYLPSEIRLQWLSVVPETFHARYSAQRRRYRYLICTRSQPSALWQSRCYWHRRPLDIDAMRTAAQYLLGEHDFSAFRSSECQAKSPNRFIESIVCERHIGWLWIDICGNAFLHHMVRNIVGTLLPIGDGRHAPLWMREVLESHDRRLAGMTAPPQGLYFMTPEYDAAFGLPPCPLPVGGLW